MLFFLTPVTVFAQQPEFGGHVEAEIDGQHYVFPTLKTDIQADVDGDLATVTVVQTFANPADKPLHARYLFPLNKDAAVFEMIMEVGDEKIKAHIERIEQAQQQFEQAKREGKSAALLKQFRPNMFTQNIANLMPGLPIKVSLRYVQTVPKIDGAYQLVIPMVVGPRFQPPGSGQPPNLDTDQIAQADSHSSFGEWELEQLPEYPPVTGLTLPKTIEHDRVSLNLSLTSAIALESVGSSSHQLDVQEISRYERSITFAKNRVIDNQDFILSYAMAGKQNQAGLLHTQNERGGFFSLMIEPPAAPVADQITSREMVFVLDCSGSMSGLPIAASKAFMREALNNLRPTDSFRIIRFSDRATEFSASPLPATPENIRKGIDYTDRLYGSGGTMMTSGIHQAFGPPTPEGSIRLVFFLTDGYIGNDHEIIRLVRNKIGNARLFAFGVGTSVNRSLLGEMSHAGRGFTRYMNPYEKVDEVAKQLATRLQTPVLTDIEIDWGKLSTKNVSPSHIPDLFAGQSLRIQGQYDKPGEYLVKVRGKVNGQAATLPLHIRLTQNNSQGEAIPLIWARSQVKEKMRQLSMPVSLRADNLNNDQLKEQITNLGLNYAITTRWTAFIAVSDKIYNTDPLNTTTKNVPLPKVKGVSANAYPTKSYPAFSGSSAPEPGGVFALLCALALALYFMRGSADRRLKYLRFYKVAGKRDANFH